MTFESVHPPPQVNLSHYPSSDKENNINTINSKLSHDQNSAIKKKKLLPTVPTAHRQAFNHVMNDIPLASITMTQKREEFQRTLPKTVFLLDWDDTCCATTYLEWYGIMADLDTKLLPQVDLQLRILEQRVLNLLKSSIQLGTVLIVTNAGDGWVELSSSRFLPAVRQFIDQHYKEIKIISARSRYIEAYKQFPWRWKALTFSDILQQILLENHYNPYELNVIVLGDSPGDRYAAYDSSNALTKTGMPITLKIVKFLERPTIDQLSKELAVLLDHLTVMTRHRGSFEVSMSNEQQQHQQQQQQQEPTTSTPNQHHEQASHNDQSSVPEGINAHDLAYHPYSAPNSTVNTSNVVDAVTNAAETSQLAASLTSVPACAAAVV